MMITDTLTLEPSLQLIALKEQIEVQEKNGSYDRLLPLLEQLNLIETDNPEILAKIASCQLFLFQFPEAISTFEQVTRLVPDSAQSMNNLGVARFMAGDLSGAETAYITALSMDHADMQIRRNLAQLYLSNLDTYTKGIYLLEDLIASDPFDLDALWMMAKCCEETGRPEYARTLCERILKIDPSYIPARLASERLEVEVAPDVI
jgi:tetratricopeptide (TPR) repeat protein